MCHLATFLPSCDKQFHHKIKKCNRNSTEKCEIGGFMSSDGEKINTSTVVDDPMLVQILSDYAYLIKYIAQKIAVKLPASVDFDDLFSAGVIGFMDAVEKYNPERDNKFKTYAEFRVRGAILDELRSQDWLPRSVRELKRKQDKARSELERNLCRPVSEGEIAKHLKIPLSEYQEKNGKTRVSLVSFAESYTMNSDDNKVFLENMEGLNSQNPFSLLRDKNMQQLVLKAIKELPEKQRIVLNLYYYEELNLKEIGKILNITESRVSQIHTTAVKRMKIKLKDIL